MKPELLNGANLAYIGDAYFELVIRKRLLLKQITNPNELHNSAVKYVSAKSHNLIVDEFFNCLTNEERRIFKRGRNYKYSSRRTSNRHEHLNSSGIEAVIGYLHLKEDKSRLDFLIDKIIEMTESQYE